MGDVLKSRKHSGDGSPLVPLRNRGCRPRQERLIRLEHKYTSLDELLTSFQGRIDSPYLYGMKKRELLYEMGFRSLLWDPGG